MFILLYRNEAYSVKCQNIGPAFLPDWFALFDVLWLQTHFFGTILPITGFINHLFGFV